MLDATAVREINEEVLRACLQAHARHGFTGELEFSQGRAFAGGELIFWKRSDVHTDEASELPAICNVALDHKWPSIAAWLGLPHSALQVFYRCGRITKHLIRSEHR